MKNHQPPLRMVFASCPTCDPASRQYLDAGRAWAREHGTFAMVVAPGSGLRSELTRAHRLKPPFVEFDGRATRNIEEL